MISIYREDIEVKNERPMRLAVLKQFLRCYFQTSKVKVSVIQSVKQFLFQLCLQDRLCLHPINETNRISRARAILCVDCDTAVLLRHSSLYLLWQTSKLVNIEEEGLLTITLHNPLSTSDGQGARGVDLLKQSHQYYRAASD